MRKWQSPVKYVAVVCYCCPKLLSPILLFNHSQVYENSPRHDLIQPELAVAVLHVAHRAHQLIVVEVDDLAAALQVRSHAQQLGQIQHGRREQHAVLVLGGNALREVQRTGPGATVQLLGGQRDHIKIGQILT